jgi:hypothetical protein
VPWIFPHMSWVKNCEVGFVRFSWRRARLR